ncbi:MAG: caspase family protein [Bacteroidota bacterium]
MIRATGFWIIFSLLLGTLSAQDTFTKVYGGKQDEHAMSVIQTRDGDYVVVGFTFSFGAGKSDIWVMKVDPYGDIIWREYYGGENFEWANDLIETRDGNYVIAGYSRDDETDISDAWVFQLNRHGEMMWSETYGGDFADEAKSITQTADGGYAVTGFTFSITNGESDIWVLRLNAVGGLLWEKNYGGTGVEQGYSIIETRDEGFLIGGYQSYNKRKHLKADMLVVKIDRNGKGIWRRAHHARGNDVVESVLETDNGDFFVAGWGFNDANNSLDAKVLRVSSGGKVLWERNFGGKGKDAVYDIVPTDDGGYALAGQTGSYGSSSDVWLLKLDENGTATWQKRSEGEARDWGHALCHTEDRGYLIVGGTKSFAEGGSDMCLMKTDARGNFGKGPVRTAKIDVEEEMPLDAYTSSPEIFKPDLYVLSVGISEFDDPSVKLTYAHTDAEAISDKFSALEGSLFRKVTVKTLQNEEATLLNIKRHVSWLEKEATQKDMVLVFYSSHGALDHKGNLYLLTRDFDPHNLFATALNIRDLTEGMSATPCKKLIFLDACHSGQSGMNLLASIKALNLNEAVGEIVSKEPGITVMTSSSGNEFSYENPRWGHGAFTKAILEGLNGEADFNNNRVISLLELNLYVTERVKDLTNGRQHPFTPINLFGDVPLFILD